MRRPRPGDRPRVARGASAAGRGGHLEPGRRWSSCRRRRRRRRARVLVPRPSGRDGNSRCRVVRTGGLGQRRRRRGARRAVALVRRSRRPAVGLRRDHPAGPRPGRPSVGLAAQQPARRDRLRARGAGREGRPASSTASGSCSERWPCCARTRSAPAPSRCARSLAPRSASSSAAHCSSGSATTRTRCGSCSRSPSLFASYAPLRISFLAGQAGFTVFLAILFNIVQPTGWRVGLVRVEDVAIGCGVSLVVGFLLWPRGAAPVVSLDLVRRLPKRRRVPIVGGA